MSARAKRTMTRSPEIELFEKKYIPVPESGCWLWTAYCDKDGYGHFTPLSTRVPIGAHRYSWLTYRGPIQSGALVCHRCDVPSCVNPRHLFLSDPAGNLEDQRNKGRRPGKPPVKTHCVRGHELSEQNVAWRLPRGYKSRQRYCVLCERERGTEWRAQHRQQVNEYARRWYAHNRRKR